MGWHAENYELWLNPVLNTQLFFSLAWLHLREKLGVQKTSFSNMKQSSSGIIGDRNIKTEALQVI